MSKYQTRLHPCYTLGSGTILLQDPPGEKLNSDIVAALACSDWVIEWETTTYYGVSNNYERLYGTHSGWRFKGRMTPFFVGFNDSTRAIKYGKGSQGDVGTGWLDVEYFQWMDYSGNWSDVEFVEDPNDPGAPPIETFFRINFGRRRISLPTSLEDLEADSRINLLFDSVSYFPSDSPAINLESFPLEHSDSRSEDTEDNFRDASSSLTLTLSDV